MKSLEITNRGIILKESGEVIENLIYETEKDIVFEIYNMFSNYENIGDIEILYKIQLDKSDEENIRSIIINNKGKILEKNKLKKLNKFLLIIFLIVVLIEIFFIFFFHLKKMELREKNENLKIRISFKEEELLILKNKINNLNSLSSKGITLKRFNKEYIYKKYLSSICLEKNSRLFLEKITMDKKILSIEGSCREMIELKNFQDNLGNNKNLKNLKFDFIKRRGNLIYFLIELEMN